MDDNRPVLIDLDPTRDDDLLADADAVAGRPVSLRRLRLTALAFGGGAAAGGRRLRRTDPTTADRGRHPDRGA
jgi:hypothetical protein